MKLQRLLTSGILILTCLQIEAQNQQDVTSYIINPSFETTSSGWALTNLSRQSNSQFTKKAGTYYMEKWTAKGNGAGSASARQTLKALPTGVYKLTVGAQNIDQNTTSRQCNGAYIYAGNSKEPVYKAADYSLEFIHTSGDVEIGFVADNAEGNWVSVDNFRLYLIRELDIWAEIQELITVADNLPVPQEIASTYQWSQQFSNSLTTAKSLTDASTTEEMNSAYNALKNAVDNEKELIDKALFAYLIENATDGTGIAPMVTQTNQYVATGATQALMRATMTGSNIKERGVCWSTERNPTVLDNRTTKSFSMKGTIFHITNLKPSTVYYLRPYVMNQTYKVAYGDEVKIVTHPKGNCTGTWDDGAPDANANERCRMAIKQTIDYFNEWTGIMGFTLSGHYGAQTPTADCSYGGWMRIGPNAGNQAIGTVLHETGHGVGVGTHWRWYSCSDTRQDYSRGYWLGREANRVLRFLENCDSKAVVFTGDNTHGWGTINSAYGQVTNGSITYDWLVNGADKDTHQELQYIGGMCILYGLFIDGLCPTSGYNNGISGYTFNFDDTKKYYLMNKNAESGLGTGVMYSPQAMLVGWNENLMNENLSDSAAWYLEYDAKNSYYAFRNAATGRYLSHESTISTKKKTIPTKSEWFQLMPDRTDVTIGTGSEKKTTHGYWLTWDNNGAKSLKATKRNSVAPYALLSIDNFNYSDNATDQQWIIISEDELDDYRKAAGTTAIREISNVNEKADTKTYDLQGRRVSTPTKGLYIINGRKVSIK